MFPCIYNTNGVKESEISNQYLDGLKEYRQYALENCLHYAKLQVTALEQWLNTGLSTDDALIDIIKCCSADEAIAELSWLTGVEIEIVDAIFLYLLSGMTVSAMKYRLEYYKRVVEFYAKL